MVQVQLPLEWPHSGLASWEGGCGSRDRAWGRRVLWEWGVGAEAGPPPEQSAATCLQSQLILSFLSRLFMNTQKRGVSKLTKWGKLDSYFLSREAGQSYICLELNGVLSASQVHQAKKNSHLGSKPSSAPFWQSHTLKAPGNCVNWTAFSPTAQLQKPSGKPVAM